MVFFPLLLGLLTVRGRTGKGRDGGGLLSHGLDRQQDLDLIGDRSDHRLHAEVVTRDRDIARRLGADDRALSPRSFVIPICALRE